MDEKVNWTHVENSSEAAIGGGIIAALVEQSGSSFIRSVACDPSQSGDDVEFIVVGGNEEVGFVYLRCRVDEVIPVVEDIEEGTDGG